MSRKPKVTKIKQGLTGRQEMFHTFSIDIETDYGDHFFGNFTCRKLSIADYAKLGVMKAELNGGMHFDPDNPGRGVDADTDSFNGMLAQLELAIVTAPEWWDLTTLTDMDVLSAVMKEVNEFESSFHATKRRKSARNGESDGADTADGRGDTQESRDGGATREVVDEEVQSALEP